jgi:hypothetical protein
MSWLLDHKETIIELAAFAWGLFWVWFRGTEWYRAHQGDKMEKARQLLEDVAKATVDRTYQEKVKDLKEKDANLSDASEEIRDYAFSVFKDEATKAMANGGADLLKSFTEAFVKAKIEDAVRAAKTDGQAAKGAQ